MKTASLALTFFMAYTLCTVDATPAAQTQQVTALPEPGEDDQAALAKLAALDIAYTARIDALRTKYRTYLYDRNWEKAYETHAEIESLRDELSAKYLLYIAEHPESAEAYNQLGLFSYDNGRPEDAAFYWKRAIELKPDFAAAHNNLGTYYGHYAQPKKALQEHRKAVELDPTQAVFHLNLATEYYTSRQHAMELYGWDLPKVFEEIMNEHRTARELEPHNYDYAKQYAETFYAAKYFGVEPDWDESIRGWYRCLETDLTKEDRANVYYQIARAYLQKNDKAKAKEVLENLEPWMKTTKQFEMVWKRATAPDPTQDPRRVSGE